MAQHLPACVRVAFHEIAGHARRQIENLREVKNAIIGNHQLDTERAMQDSDLERAVGQVCGDLIGKSSNV